MHTENPTEYWGFWRRYRKPPQNNNHIDIDTFTRHYKKMSKPNVNHNFDYEYMNKISSFIDKCSSENMLCHNQYIDDIMNAPISEDELSYVLRKAKNGKAGGADAIPTEFYKYSTPNLNKAILALFNYVFENGDYPEIWSHGIISPIYKAGEMRYPVKTTVKLLFYRPLERSLILYLTTVYVFVKKHSDWTTPGKRVPSKNRTPLIICSSSTQF